MIVRKTITSPSFRGKYNKIQTSTNTTRMSWLFESAIGICYGDEDDDEDDDEFDFCGNHGNKIVEIAIRRDFLLLRLQELVDAETVQHAGAAVKAMAREAGKDEKLLKFLVRAGTVEIIRGSCLFADDKDGKPHVPGEPVVDDLNEGKRDIGGAGKACATTKDSSSRSVAAQPLLEKLLPYHKQRKLRELKKKQRDPWVMIMGGTSIRE